MDIKLDHIAINVKDIAKSVAWYVENVDMEVLYQDDTWAVLSRDNFKIALTLKSQHPPHIGFVINEHIRRERFADKEFKEHRDGSTSYYASDPDGNYIEYLLWPE